MSDRLKTLTTTLYDFSFVEKSLYLLNRTIEHLEGSHFSKKKDIKELIMQLKRGSSLVFKYEKAIRTDFLSIFSLIEDDKGD